MIRAQISAFSEVAIYTDDSPLVIVANNAHSSRRSRPVDDIADDASDVRSKPRVNHRGRPLPRNCGNQRLGETFFLELIGTEEDERSVGTVLVALGAGPFVCGIGSSRRDNLC